jgi:hypothetical protein
MLCSSSCNKSFSSHSKMFCAFLLFSLAPALWKVLLVRRKFAVLYSRFKLECDHSKSMLLLTRISRAFESHSSRRTRLATAYCSGGRVAIDLRSTVGLASLPKSGRGRPSPGMLAKACSIASAASTRSRSPRKRPARLRIAWTPGRRVDFIGMGREFCASTSSRPQQRDSARAHQGAPAPFRNAIKLDQ